MTPIAQMDKQKWTCPPPVKTSPCRCVVCPIQAPDNLRYLRHLRIQLRFPDRFVLEAVSEESAWRLWLLCRWIHLRREAYLPSMVDPLAHSPTRRFQPVFPFLLLAVASAALAQVPSGAGASAEWHTEAGLRWRSLDLPGSGRPGFTLMAPGTTRLQFTNRLDELAGAANRTLYNGAGVAAGDVDGDGRPDLFFCDISGTNALFRNLGGFTFEDITQTSGIRTPIPGCRGAVLADVDGDRDLDLLLAVNGGGVLSFINDGRGRFAEATSGSGTASNLGASTIAIADVDGNGTPDLYVANYSTEDVRDRGRVNIQMIGGKPVLPGSRPDRFLLVDGKLVEAGQPDQLYLNEGAGRFRAVSWTDGSFLDENGNPLKAPPNDWGLTATFRDLNGDGAPDLYVCNDYWTPDRCWINDGRGRFRALPTMAMRKTPASSMGVDVADVDRDGDMDLFVVDMLSRYPHLRKRQGFAQAMTPVPMGVDLMRHQVMRNVLLLARGDGTYADAAFQAGVPASDWSWSPIFLDVDLDGYEDLLISAGHFRDVQDYDAEARIQGLQHTWKGQPNDQERQRAFTRELMEHYRIYPLLHLPVGAFRNGRDGRFEEVTQQWGLNHPAVHHGLATADLDGDGDADLVANTLNGPAKLFRNEGTNGRVSVRLIGRAPNTQAVGARVTLLHSAVPPQSADVTVEDGIFPDPIPTSRLQHRPMARCSCASAGAMGVRRSSRESVPGDTTKWMKQQRTFPLPCLHLRQRRLPNPCSRSPRSNPRIAISRRCMPTRTSSRSSRTSSASLGLAWRGWISKAMGTTTCWLGPVAVDPLPPT